MTPLMCMAVAIFFEARAEPIEGREAVANVIINRDGTDNRIGNLRDVPQSVNNNNKSAYKKRA